MSFSLSSWFDARFFKTGNNAPLTGGKIYTYLAGTTTPVATYSNDSGTTNTNPIVLDADGRANIYLDDSVAYRFILKDANDVTQKDVDNVRSGKNSIILKVQTMADLRALVGSDTINAVDMLGYYVAGDGGANSFRWDAASGAADNNGSVIKPTSVTGVGRWKSIFKQYNPNQFGAKGNGADNDTVAVIAALAATPTNSYVVGQGQSVYSISSRVDVTNKRLKDIVFSYSSGSSSLVLIGNSQLINTTIYVNTTAPAFSNPLCGAVNLHLADGAIIDGLYIPDGSSVVGTRVGIFCSSLASNVTVKNCTMDYIAWPLLYNDDTAFVSNIRVVDGVDYSSQSIGKGLNVTNCSFGASNKLQNGDGLEINCPQKRFSDVVVSNCIVNKAVGFAGHGANGIGLGFANIDGLLVTGCYIKNCDGSGGGLHCENSKGVIFSNNMIVDCWKGIGIGDDGDDIVISGNTVIRSEEAVQIVGVATPVRNLSFVGNCIIDTVNYPFAATNLDGALISDNLFRNNGVAINAFITLLQTGALGTLNIRILDNIFRIDNGINSFVFGKSGTVLGVHSAGNIFNGVINNNIAGYIALIRTVGVSEDHYNNIGASATSMNVTLSGTPVGYLSGLAGNLATDLSAGVIYRHNGTNWIPRVGGVVKNTTANRPTLSATDIGVQYFDTTLDADGKPIWWTGTAWVDATGLVV